MPLLNVENTERKRWLAFAGSLLGHALVIAVLALFNTNFQSETSPLENYNVVMIPRVRPKDRLTWYRRPRRTVPEIRPDRPFGPRKKPTGEKTRSDEILIARSPKSVSKQQLIRRPDHPEPLPIDVPAPNLVILQLNDALAVPKPPRKVFVPPQAKPSPPQPRATLSVAEPPPALNATELQTRNDFSVPTLAQKKLPKFFVPPSLRASGSGSVPHATIPQDMPAPPDVGSQNGAVGPQAVILGLNPQAAMPPPGSRNGEFAKAPNAGPPSSGNSTDSGAAIVPGVYAHGTPGPAAETDSSSSSGMPDRRLVKIVALPGVNRTMSAPLRPSSRIVPAFIDAAFANRNVYTLVIPGPQLPNYPGDWVLWFAEHQPDSEAAAQISAPIPSRKYARMDAADPPKGAPVTATIQFSALLDHTGRVTAAKVIRGGRASEEFRRKALEELETWEFMPALRNGVPVDVDVVLEIPFELHLGGASPPAPRAAQ